MPPADLTTCAGELRQLVDELAELTGCGGAWGMRVLRRNVELAVLSPRTLESPDNQLDFIEELAEALWDATDGAVRQAVRPGPASDETGRREERRRVLVERLNEIAQRLCADAEAWREGTGYPQDDHSSEPCSHIPSPGCAQASV